MIINTIANYLMFGVSAVLSINLFYKLGDNIVSSILLSLTAFLFEYVKLYSIRAISSSTEGKKGFIWHVVMYSLFCFISLVCSFGFALEATQDRGDKNIIQSSVVVSLQSENQSLQEQINFRLSQLKSLPTNYYQTANNIHADIKTLQAKIQSNTIAMQTNISGYQKADMFMLIADATGFDRKTIMFAILLALSIMLEIGIAYTALFNKGNAVKTSDRQSPLLEFGKEKIINYIDKLYENAPQGKLNGSAYISKLLGMTIYECEMIKKALSSIKYKNAPLLTVGQGATKTSFNKETMVSIVERLL